MAPSATSVDAQVKRLIEIVRLTLVDELERNGLNLSAKFLHARASEAGLLSILRNESVDPTLREELKELIESDGVMEMLKGFNAESLFALIQKDEGAKPSPQFKSKLLGGEQAEKNSRTKPAAKVRSLDAARGRRNKNADKKDDDNNE